MRTLLLLTCFLLGPGQATAQKVAAPPEKGPKSLPDDVVKAWKEAGAEVGWMWPLKITNEFNSVFLTFERSREDLGGARVVPAFQFKNWRAEMIVKLPAPASAFGIDLGGTNVTDAGLKELAGLKGLTYLALEGTRVTDVGLKELAGLKGLTDLHLGGTKVTDAGLKELVKLKGLSHLDLIRATVTDKGVQKLSSALPECEIWH
jgi:hypothetical protein